MADNAELRFGIIGTGWISQKFVRALRAVDNVSVVAVYSRTLSKGTSFVKTISEHIIVYTDLDQMLLDKQIDAIYIASPNSAHYTQIISCLTHEKHVLVEKPAVVTSNQFLKIEKLLQKKPNLYFMEAMKNIFLPSFEQTAALIPQLGPLDGANLIYLTSDLKKSDLQNPQRLPSVLSRKAARGVLYDLGVYLISSALNWFGTPIKVEYYPKLIDNPDGADYYGHGTLFYKTFNVDILIGNMTSSQAPSEIYGSQGTLVLNHPTHLENITLLKKDNTTTDIKVPAISNTMMPEIEHFTKMIFSENYEEMQRLLILTKTSTNILQTMRENAGFDFP